MNIAQEDQGNVAVIRNPGVLLQLRCIEDQNMQHVARTNQDALRSLGNCRHHRKNEQRRDYVLKMLHYHLPDVSQIGRCWYSRSTCSKNRPSVRPRSEPLQCDGWLRAARAEFELKGRGTAVACSRDVPQAVSCLQKRLVLPSRSRVARARRPGSQSRRT